MGPGNCDPSTWQVIFNSLDIDFIHDYLSTRQVMWSFITIIEVIHIFAKLPSIEISLVS